MNCHNYQSDLEDFHYGELSEGRAAQVRAHLAECRECAALRDELEREQEIFAQFYEQSALEPGAEMWDAIRSRIDVRTSPETETSGGWWRSLFTAGALSWLLRPELIRQGAFALVLIALSAAITTMVVRRERNDETKLVQTTVSPTPQPAVSPTPAQAPEVIIAQTAPAPAQSAGEVKKAPPARSLTDQERLNLQIARAEREFQSAIKLLDTAIAKRKDLLDPELVKQYESSLALIDTSIAASRRAMRERPDDPSASQFLLAAYARKVELMQDIAMR